MTGVDLARVLVSAVFQMGDEPGREVRAQLAEQMRRAYAEATEDDRGEMFFHLSQSVADLLTALEDECGAPRGTYLRRWCELPGDPRIPD